MRRTLDFLRFGILALAATGLFATSAAVAEEAKPQDKTTYADHVRPILREHCFSCHNQNKAQNDLALDTYEKLMAGGASGKAVEPGDPGSSYLFSLVSHKEEPHMPPNQDKLPDAKLAVVRRWIEGGALKDSGSKAATAKKPGLDLAPATAGKRPEGPAILPEGLRRQPVVYTPRAAAVTAIASSPWAPLVAVAGQEQVSLYNSDTAAFLGVVPFPEGIPQVIRFSRSGSLMIVGGGKDASRGLVAVYDVKTGKRLFEVGDELDTVLAADINDTHTLVALGGPQRVVRVYSTSDGSLAYEVRKHTDWIYAVEFSPDGVLLATSDRSGGLMVWEAETGRDYLNLEGHKAAVTGVSWRADSNVLASSSEDGAIKLWEMQNGRQIKSVNAHGGGATAVQFTHDGRFVSAGRDKVAKAWDANGNQARAFPAFGEPALEVAFTHDGGRVVAGDWSGEVRLWNAADGALAAHLPANPPTLEMALKDALEKLAVAQQAADKSSAELAQADAALTQKKNAAGQAAQEAAQKAEAAKTAATQAEAARKATAEAGPKQEAAAKAAADAENAAKQASEQAAAARQTADRLAAEVAELQKNIDANSAPPDAPVQLAAKKAAAEEAARAAAQKADAAKTATAQADAARKAAAESATQRDALAKAAADAENASKQAVQQAVAAKQAADRMGPEMAELQKQRDAKAPPVQAALQAAAAAKAVADRAAADKAAWEASQKK